MAYKKTHVGNINSYLAEYSQLLNTKPTLIEETDVTNAETVFNPIFKIEKLLTTLRTKGEALEQDYAARLKKENDINIGLKKEYKGIGEDYEKLVKENKRIKIQRGIYERSKRDNEILREKNTELQNKMSQLEKKNEGLEKQQGRYEKLKIENKELVEQNNKCYDAQKSFLKALNRDVGNLAVEMKKAVGV